MKNVSFRVSQETAQRAEQNGVPFQFEQQDPESRNHKEREQRIWLDHR